LLGVLVGSDVISGSELLDQVDGREQTDPHDVDEVPVVGDDDRADGLLAFLFFLARTALGRFTPAQATAAIVVSYYWHFVDVVWIGLFSTIYFIR